MGGGAGRGQSDIPVRGIALTRVEQRAQLATKDQSSVVTVDSTKGSGRGQRPFISLFLNCINLKTLGVGYEPQEEEEN